MFSIVACQDQLKFLSADTLNFKFIPTLLAVRKLRPKFYLILMNVNYAYYTNRSYLKNNHFDVFVQLIIM